MHIEWHIRKSIIRNRNNIIGELLINPYLTQQEIADKLGVGRRTVIRYMAALQDKKIIVKDGSKRDGYLKVLK